MLSIRPASQATLDLRKSVVFDITFTSEHTNLSSNSSSSSRRRLVEIAHPFEFL
jgi:hypothetical protein